MPSTLACVETLCHEIRGRLAAQGLAGLQFPVELVLRECLCNAVTHGNRCDARKTVRLELRVGRRWIRLQIADEGPGFAWRRARKAPWDVAAISGRGLAICALYASRLAFNRAGNQITLWIEKPKGGGRA
jgi:serine/threonine-protein kinase RsbW